MAARLRGAGGYPGAGRGGRKKRNPDNPADLAILRSLYPDYDELMAGTTVDYRTLCKTDAEFGRKFGGMPELVDASRCFRGHENSVDAVAWGPDPGTCVSASHDATLRVWDVDSGKCLETLRGHDGGLYHCAVAISKRLVVSCGSGKEKNVLVWQWPQKKVVQALTGHPRSVHHVAISSDAASVCTAGQDGRVMVHDLTTGASVMDRCPHSSIVHVATFCRGDPRLIISGGRDGRIQLMDLREQNVAQSWRLPSGVANSVMIQPAAGVDRAHDGYDVYAAEFFDSHTVFSGGADNKMKRWDLRKAFVGTSGDSNCADEFLGHSSAVRSLTVSADGLRAASGCEDGSIRVWSLTKRTPSIRSARADHGKQTVYALRACVGHVAQVSCCAWSPTTDGATATSFQLLSSSWDQSLRLYHVPSSIFA